MAADHTHIRLNEDEVHRVVASETIRKPWGIRRSDHEKAPTATESVGLFFDFFRFVGEFALFDDIVELLFDFFTVIQHSWLGKLVDAYATVCSIDVIVSSSFPVIRR